MDLEYLLDAAHVLGVTIPPTGIVRDHTAPSGWIVDGEDMARWIDRECELNAVYGPRSAATRRQRRGRP